MIKSNIDLSQVGEIDTHPPPPPPSTAGWVLYIWDTIMPRVLNEFIKQEDIRSKLE